MNPAAPPTIRIHPADNVIIARRQLLGGTVLADEGGVTVTGLVPPGHKLATAPIAAATSMWPRASRSSPFAQARGSASTMSRIPSSAMPSHMG